VIGKDQERRQQATRTDESEREPGFLDRWSQRKREDEARATPPTQGLAPAAVEAPPETRPEAVAIELTDADMPPLESLEEDSDYSGFLSPKVSEALRKAALRKLFSQSRFNAVDGLDDYAEDYTRFEPLGNVVTHEMRRMLERARKALEEGSAAKPEAPPVAAEADSGADREQAEGAVESGADGENGG
jgi:hypothetical protein